MATFGPCFCKRGREGERKRGGEGERKRGRERGERKRGREGGGGRERRGLMRRAVSFPCPSTTA